MQERFGNEKFDRGFWTSWENLEANRKLGNSQAVEGPIVPLSSTVFADE